MEPFKGYVKIKMTEEDIKKTRKSVKIGDILRYKTVRQDILNEKITHTVWENVVVTKIHKNLVEVKYADQPTKWPIKTMTYREIAFQRAGIDYDELRGKKK